MIGNAVPVNLGAYIADAIIRYSGEKDVKKAFKTTKHQSSHF